MCHYKGKQGGNDGGREGGREEKGRVKWRVGNGGGFDGEEEEWH